MQQRHHPVPPERWDALAAEPEFRALVRSRRRFLVPATIFFVLFYLGLPVSVGIAPAAMSRPVFGPLTAAYLYAFAEFAMAWVMLALYLWQARGYDVAAARCRKHEAEEIRT